MSSNRPLTKLMNIGAVTAAHLTDLGIRDEAGLRAVGAIEAYRRLQAHDPRWCSLLCLYALQGALTDTAWDRLPPDEVERLKSEAMPSASLQGNR